MPLISYDRAITVALDIIDRDGLEALSTRRLAREMKVTSAAFYHHFTSKTEIIIGVLERVLREVDPPPADGIDWREWIITFASRTREVLLAHPNIVPAMAYHVPRTLAPGQYEVGMRMMRNAGIAPHDILPMMEAVEMFMMGFVAFNAVPSGYVRSFDDVSVQRFPTLSEAVAAQPADQDARFRISLAAILDGWASRDHDSAEKPRAHPQMSRRASTTA
jgi:TetR/AcrR family transcriptional regulator, tetracycline repressor protein